MISVFLINLVVLSYGFLFMFPHIRIWINLFPWFIKGIGGIRDDPEHFGYKRLVIKPHLVGDLTFARTSMESLHGKIVSNWKRKGTRLEMDVTIPPNTSATVYVPAKNADAVTEGGGPAARAEGVTFVRMEKGAAVFTVGSGSYRFASTIGTATRR